mmetsp:Transcript_19470/g.29558  ORF Transcript_19470/g.29558 Transcript_19470/m.29558 type:complete len:158 (-) Transcript_19470:96-569(-)
MNLSLSVKNPLSDYEVREKVAFDPSETVEQDESSREPPYHFGLKWEGSKKISTLTVLNPAETKSALKKLGKKAKGFAVKEVYTAEDSGSYVPLLAFECRGLEPYAFHPMGNEIKVTSEGGGVFESDVDLSEGDWADYDEENDLSVSISEFETKFESL